jgi:aspartate/methionine/tyrosine aminotransferase
VAQNLYIAAPTLSQHAALAAFDRDTLNILESRRREFCRRRDYLLPELERLGFLLPAHPQGAFYLYAACDRFSDDSERLAAELLESKAVAVTPGLDFGSWEPRRYLRFAYTTDRESLEEGVSRIKAYLGNL